jgi:hypothetical protein
VDVRIDHQRSFGWFRSRVVHCNDGVWACAQAAEVQDVPDAASGIPQGAQEAGEYLPCTRGVRDIDN